MNLIVIGARRLFLRVAFVCVMAGAGGLAGAIGGLILVLISQVVLGMNAGILELMPPSVTLGSVAALSAALFLATRRSVQVG